MRGARLRGSVLGEEERTDSLERRARADKCGGKERFGRVCGIESVSDLARGSVRSTKREGARAFCFSSSNDDDPSARDAEGRAGERACAPRRRPATANRRRRQLGPWLQFVVECVRVGAFHKMVVRVVVF
jgi:hypothetical protein